MNKRWPLHPKPYDSQLLSDWIKDLAKIYEISYPNFCKRVLMLTSDEIDDLRNSVPERDVSWTRCGLVKCYLKTCL